MIQVKMTEHLGGFSIAGDYNDFDRLYDALSEVVSSNYDSEETTEMRILGLCYDLRHANQGDRTFINVENSVNDYTAQYQGMILPRMNVYTSFNVLFPEIVFILLSINEKLNIYARKKTSNHDYCIFSSKDTMWDEHIAVVRMFQSQVLKALFDILEDKVVTRIKNLMSKSHIRLANFHHQYIDQMNIEFAQLDKEKREKKLALMFKRFIEPNKAYESLANDLKTSARFHNCHPSKLKLPGSYPEEVNW